MLGPIISENDTPLLPNLEKNLKPCSAVCKTLHQRNVLNKCIFLAIFQIRKEYKKFIDYKPPTSGTHTTSKSANGTAGQGTGSTGLQMQSRKKSDFSDLNIPRHGSSSA